MSYKWNELPRVVIVVRDQSGSMDQFNPSIHQGCRDMETLLDGLATPIHFVSFAAYAAESSSIDNLRHVNGGTSIAPAFKLVKEILAARGTPKQVDLVFISDGEDMDMPACKLGLDAMEPLTCHCRLWINAALGLMILTMFLLMRPWHVVYSTRLVRLPPQLFEIKRGNRTYADSSNPHHHHLLF
jgi:hypothetical protein